MHFEGTGSTKMAARVTGKCLILCYMHWRENCSPAQRRRAKKLSPLFKSLATTFLGDYVNHNFGTEQATPASGTANSIDRRRSRRVKVSIPARVRPYYQSPQLSEEFLTATNLSRDGFYFISRHPSYRADMHLYVACPAGHSQTGADAEGARVVRVDLLGEDKWGVAVTFLRSASLYHGGFPSQRSKA